MPYENQGKVRFLTYATKLTFTVNSTNCEICGNSFSYKQNLAAHVKTIHQSQKKEKCKTFGTYFGQ